MEPPPHSDLSFHPEVLTRTQRGVLQHTGPLLNGRGFRLAGGTALALLLGHRRSVDFDWFIETTMPDSLILARELTDAGVAWETDEVARGTLHGRVEEVRVSLLEYRYPLLAPPVAWPEYGCSVLSLDDIACMKLSAITQRGSRKDFVDLFALGTRHRPLTELIELYRRKFDIQDVGHVLFALAYFDDAEAEPMPQMLWEPSWEDMKARIRGWVRRAAGQGSS